MRQTLGAGLIVIVSLAAACSPANQGDTQASDQASLATARIEMLARMKASDYRSPPTLLCAAKRVSATTAETMNLVWINERGDLTTAQERSDASRDAVDSIEACGGNMVALAGELDASGDTVPKALALALLEAGRM